MTGYLIRAVGSALLIGLIFMILPGEAIAEAFRELSLWHFLSVLVAFLVLHVFAGLKWWLLLDASVPPALAVRAHFGGLAGNLCLPGAIGGDAVRGGIVYAASRRGPEVVAGGIVDRMIDFSVLVLLMMSGVLLSITSGFNMELSAEIIATVVGVVCLGCVGLIFLPRLWSVLPGLPGRAQVEKFGAAYGMLGRRKGRLAAVAVSSLAIQFGLVLLAAKLAWLAGAEFAFAHWLIAWPLAKLIAVVPISLNGLGLREAALAGVFAAIAPGLTDPAPIVASGLAWQAVLFVAGGLGGLILLLTPAGRR